MLSIRTLQDIPQEDIIQCFNDSFVNYIIPTEFNITQFSHKIKTDNIRFDLSIGAFEQNKLIGFMLHGFDTINGIPTAYNAATGILPNMRGRHITDSMYKYSFDLLRAEGIQSVQAEIITTNIASLRAAQRIGFKQQRKFVCLSGSLIPTTVPTVAGVRVEPLREFDWQLLATFWDWLPAWQNSPYSIERTSTIRAYAAYNIENKLIGYLFFNAVTHRIVQLAVHTSHRGQGVAQLLLATLSQKFPNIDFTVINFDDSDKTTAHLLAKFGLQPFLHQIDMLLTF